MFAPLKQISSERINITGSLSFWSRRKIAADSKIEVVQTSETLSATTWKQINKLLIQRPDINLRIYGSSANNGDLSVLKHVPDVHRLSIDCIRRVGNIEVLSDLQKLSSVAIGVYELKSFAFLEELPKSLTRLSLQATASKKPDLSAISHFKDLKHLYIEGQNKNIDVIGHLEKLETVVLRSLKNNDLSYLRGLTKLWSVDIKLGSVVDLEALRGLNNLKYLELWQVRGVSDLDVVSSLTGLQYLFLQSLKHVSALPDFSKLKHLRRLYMEAMKGLNDISSLKFASSLEDLIHVSALNTQANECIEVFENPSIKSTLINLGSAKKNAIVTTAMEQKGIEKFSFYPFEYH